ncbi:uncharacterized protein LOC109839592 isoform X1 [Asparagus officinalis]|nr:uncharacterized protein LOC109839592 isoform X1 [Asparagus officinalis]
MILTALPPPPLPKFTKNLQKSSPFSSISISDGIKCTLLNALELRKRGAVLCTKEDSANDVFDGFSVLSSDTPWDHDNLWSTFGAYFFILHIPLSYGGLSITANILHQSVLDPLATAVSAVILQTTETAAALALFYYSAKPQYTFFKFISRMPNSKQRNWINASALGIGFLVGLVLLTSTLADRFVGPKDVNNPILKDILSYSPISRTACFSLYCLISPLLEEVVYRGFLLRSLASTTKWWQAVIISSCVFSVAHFSVENFLQLFLIGCVLGSAYCWTGNLAAPFTIHSAYNAMILFVTIMSQTEFKH